MPLRIVRFFALLLGALALTMESAHVLELPQKLQYPPELYSAVNTTLYRYFAFVGGIYKIASIALVALLAYLTRHDGRVGRLSFFALLGMGLSLMTWALIVAPVNGEIGRALERAPQTVPSLWTELRMRWETGHVIGFVLHLAGFAALVLSVLDNGLRATLRSHPAST